MPDGPAAEPRRAVRKLASSSVSGRGHGSAATWLSTSGLSGTTGVWGRRRGSRSSANVAAFPSASGSAVRARLAAESSPMRTSALARAARRSTLVPPAGGREAGRAGVEEQAARRRESQSPRRKASARRSSSAGSMRVWPGSRCRSMRGARKNSFHPRTSSSGPAPATACSSPVRSANRRVPLSWVGRRQR